MRIGFVFDAKSDYRMLGLSEEAIAEFDADETVDFVEDTLCSLGHHVTRIGHLRNLVARLARGERWDLVFNIAEGLAGPGREAQVPCLLEAYAIPCAMSDARVMALCLDKVLTKRVVRDLAYRTPDFVEIRAREDLRTMPPVAYPAFVKPSREGSSKGIGDNARVDDRRQLDRAVCDLLQRFAQPVLIEPYLPGREFTVGIWERDGMPAVIGVLEIVYVGRLDDFNSSVKKEVAEDRTIRYLLVDDELAREAAAMALGIFRDLDCRDVARVDVRCDAQGTPHFLEINPLPGLRPRFSELMQLAEKAGYSASDVIVSIVASASRRSLAIADRRLIDVVASPGTAEAEAA